MYLSAAGVLCGLCAAWFSLAEVPCKNKHTFIMHFILGLSGHHLVESSFFLCSSDF